MAEVDNSESERRKRREFYNELDQYYRRKWNATLKIPCISGQAVDVYALYQKVTALGGWNKVCTYNKWNDIVDSLGIPSGCAASEHAIKTIYMRYLAKFEQSQLFGEADGENGDGPGSSLGGRSPRGRSYLSLLGGQQAGVNSYPRYASSVLPDIYSGGANSSMSDGQSGAQCERLIRCFTSGLPNEVDFALNICLLLSSPANAGGCQFPLRLCDFSRLMALLLAHAGVFDEGEFSYRHLYVNAWKDRCPGRDFELFWQDLLQTESDSLRLLHGEECNGTTPIASDYSPFGCLELAPKDAVVLMKRVEQVANIVRNFSFESDYRHILADSRPMMRYLLMAINCRNISFQSLALDTLSNIACELNLDDINPNTLQLLMSTLSRCLHSDNKLHVIRALETIGNLCCNERNEQFLCDSLEPVIIRRMIALLAVKDIMMCVYLLECLYQMTEMGQVPCQRIAEQSRAVDTLVQFVTVEAVSFGPNGLLGMKVVEYGMPVPHTAILPQPTRTVSSTTPMHPNGATLDRLSTPASSTVVRLPRPAAVSSPSPSSSSGTSSTLVQHPPPFLARPVRPASSIAPTIASSVTLDLHTPAKTHQPQLPPSPKKEISFDKCKVEDATKIMVGSPGSTTPSQLSPNCRGPAVTVQQDQHIEQLSMNWLRQNCGADATCHVSRGELYASYVQEMRRLHNSMAVSVTVFTNYVRQIFPSCTVRQLDSGGCNSGGVNDGVGTHSPNCRGTLLQFDGLKFSPKPAAKESLNSPTPSTRSTSSPISNLVAQHPLMQQILSSGNSPEKQGVAGIHGSPTISRTLLSTSSALRSRSDSVGTLDSGYSLPGTPDSISSGFSSTNSSTGHCGPTNFALFQQQQGNSPKTPKKSKSTNRKSSKVSAAKTDSPGAMVTNNGGLVNGSSATGDSISSTASAICQLEVCHPAQEARTVIETGDSHEARIVRVENTIAMVSSQFFVPDNNVSRSSPPLTTRAINGAASAGENTCTSEGSNGCDQATTVTTVSSNSTKKKVKKTKSTDSGTTPTLNGLVKTSAPTGSQTLVSRISSPSPDMEAMKQNVTQSIQSIQELLAGDSNESNAATPAKKVTKKGETPRKRKSVNDSLDKTPAKKKKYPKKKKNVNETLSTSQSNDSFSEPSTSSTPSAASSVAVATSGRSSSFRLPLPPSSSQTTSLVQQAVLASSGQSSQVVVRIPTPPVGQLKYVCEWDGCGKALGSSNAVYYHIVKVHVNSDDVRICRWRHCDQTVRLRWSLVAHIQDVHCNEQLLRAAALRKYEISTCGHSNIQEPRPVPPHPGYPNDAAIVAIRRHALVNLAKDVTDESEGPVTKSIRLTSSLILRNLARYSSDGRRILRKYERMLAYVAFSRLESSAALAQCLSELAHPTAASSPVVQTSCT